MHHYRQDLHSHSHQKHIWRYSNFTDIGLNKKASWQKHICPITLSKKLEVNSPRNTEHNEKSIEFTMAHQLTIPIFTRVAFILSGRVQQSRKPRPSPFTLLGIPYSSKKLQGFPSHNRKRSSNHANKVHRDKITQCWPMFIRSFGVVFLSHLTVAFLGCVCFNRENLGDDLVDTWTAITSRGVPLKKGVHEDIILPLFRVKRNETPKPQMNLDLIFQKPGFCLRWRLARRKNCSVLSSRRS